MDYSKIIGIEYDKLLTIILQELTQIVQCIKKFINNELNQFGYNLQRLDPLGNPVVYQIELTNHCPMTCVMCPRTNCMTRELGYMDESLLNRIIDEAFEFSSRIFFHHFGDSLMHPKLGKFIRYANQHNIRAYLSANPILLTKKRSRKLVDNGLYELVLSLDGITNETSAAIRGHAARNIDLAEKNILSFLEYRRAVGSKTPFLIIQIVRQKQNVQEIERWVRKWNEVDGVDRVKVKLYITWDGQDEYLNSMKSEENRCSEPVDIVCDKPWTSVTILWDGQVVPCCFDYDGAYVLGDLHRQLLKEIWGGKRMRYLRKCHREKNRHKIKLCKQCTDMEGYPVRKWYYPFNRWFISRNRLGDEWSIS